MKFVSTAALALALAFGAVSASAADAPAKSLTPQQQRMKDCNTQATGKKGEERRAFMSTCLKGGSPSAQAAAPANTAAASTTATQTAQANPSQGKKKSHRSGGTAR